MMKFDILELLNDEYPQHLSVDEEFFHEFMKDMPNGDIHINNLHSLKKFFILVTFDVSKLEIFNDLIE